MSPQPSTEWSSLAAVGEELAELLEAASKPATIAFDADSTLWLSDVANRIWDYIIQHRLLHAEAASLVARVVRAQGGRPTGDAHADMAELFARYARGEADERALVELQATGFVGMREEELREIARASFESGERTLAAACYEGMRELLDALRVRQARLVVCSGSPQLVVEEAARLYDIPASDVLSLRSRIVAGRLTAELEGAFTTGEGKVDALRRGRAHPPLASFGDSPSDIPLLRSATHVACMINPRPGLRDATGTMPGRVRWIRIMKTIARFDVPIPEQDESTII